MAKPKKLSSGNYQIRFKVKNAFTGEIICKKATFSTAKECRDWETETRGQMLHGVSADKVKLIDFFDIWYDTFKRHSVGRDHSGKIKSVRKSIVDYFDSDVLLSDITKLKYQSWINYIGVTKNQAASTVKDKHTIFKSMMAEAVDMDYIVKNPCIRINLVGRDTSKEKKRTLTFAEWQRLRDVILDSTEDCPSKWVALTMMYTGMRFQEATGLQNSDVDLERKVIKITEAYDYKHTKERTDTKTKASVRETDMVDELVEILTPVVNRTKSKEKIVSIHSKSKPVYLFPNTQEGPFYGEPITNTALNKYIEKKCKAAGVERITSHAFRHAQTDLLVLSDADMIYTQKQLGHADPHTTLKYYSSLSPEIGVKNKLSRNEFLKENINS